MRNRYWVLESRLRGSGLPPYVEFISAEGMPATADEALKAFIEDCEYSTGERVPGDVDLTMRPSTATEDREGQASVCRVVCTDDALNARIHQTNCNP